MSKISPGTWHPLVYYQSLCICCVSTEWWNISLALFATRSGIFFHWHNYLYEDFFPGVRRLSLCDTCLLHPPKYSFEISLWSFYNKLSYNIRSCDELPLFKSKLFYHLMRQSFSFQLAQYEKHYYFEWYWMPIKVCNNYSAISADASFSSHCLSMVWCTVSSFGLCGAIERRLSHFLPRWLRTGWQSVISHGKLTWNTPSWSGNWTKAREQTVERTDSEIHSFSLWAIMTLAMERTDSEIHSFPLALRYPSLSHNV